MPKATDKAREVHKSCGNVFRDLGLTNPDERLAKAQLAHRICEIIASRRLNQTEAAAATGLDQPKISALKRGRLAGFSVERLFRCLNHLGQDVNILVQPARGRRQAATQVVLTER